MEPYSPVGACTFTRAANVPYCIPARAPMAWRMSSSTPSNCLTANLGLLAPPKPRPEPDRHQSPANADWIAADVTLRRPSELKFAGVSTGRNTQFSDDRFQIRCVIGPSFGTPSNSRVSAMSAAPSDDGL